MAGFSTAAAFSSDRDAQHPAVNKRLLTEGAMNVKSDFELPLQETDWRRQEAEWRQQESAFKQQVQRAETLQQENQQLKHEISRLNG